MLPFAEPLPAQAPEDETKGTRMRATDDAEVRGLHASRRVFLQATFAAAAILPSTPSALADEATLQLDRVVVDGRFPEAVALGREIARGRAILSAMSGDLTEIWSKDLRTAWRAAPMTLAGVTTPAGLFVLETLAMDHRMRVVRRATIPPSDLRETPLVSWVIAPRPRSPAAV